MAMTTKDMEKIGDGSHTLSAPPKHAELAPGSQPESEDDETAKGSAKSEPAPPNDPDEHPRTAKPSAAD